MRLHWMCGEPSLVDLLGTTSTRALVSVWGVKGLDPCIHVPGRSTCLLHRGSNLKPDGYRPHMYETMQQGQKGLRLMGIDQFASVVLSCNIRIEKEESKVLKDARRQARGSRRQYPVMESAPSTVHPKEDPSWLTVIQATSPLPLIPPPIRRFLGISTRQPSQNSSADDMAEERGSTRATNSSIS